ncbi:MAG: DUF2789 domain-containing protein [Polaromonas sp.]|jgi:hypothetical protein|nr:DUF2789 domain-containing protein [Polaromonas sp.]
MDQPIHRFSELFAQLGLSADAQAIAQFIATHAPLAADIDLPDAAFWTPAQSAFLREEKLDDADWAELVDQLNLALRQPASGT